MIRSPLEILNQYFGYSEFREGQEKLIDAILDGKDAIGIMPTGGGKSLCYQIPALLLDGVTLVVSPLISLMKDQVAALKSAGISAAYINSSLSWSQTQRVYQQCRQGAYHLIYVAPERLLTEEFLTAMQEIPISMVAVDEAHCISQWGQDFRPSYMKIAEFIRHLPRRPVVSAFTATATQRVQIDIERSLNLLDPVRVITDFNRPNLKFTVLHPAKKRETLLRLIKEREQDCGIIYCATRKDVDQLCELLQEKSYSATRYHAGLDKEERRQNQEAFIYDRRKIMVATNAFGMGIDKSNVSFVIHYNMPKSLEAYYQEAGRAGRDGSKADCILLYSDADVSLSRRLLEQNPREDLTEEECKNVIAGEAERLHAMVHYCQTTDCLCGCILSYFGQAHPKACGNCSNCTADLKTEDITTEAQMILSCVKRVKDYLGYFMGPSMIIRILRGSKDKRIQQLKLNELPTYGLMKTYSRPHLHEMLSALEELGYLKTEFQHGSIRLTRKASEVLFHGQTVQVCLRNKEKENKPQTRSQIVDTADNALFEALKQLRYQIAKEDNVPAYVVFSNANLLDMAEKKPQTPEEFLNVSGVGAYKAKRYGDAFLAEIKKQLSGIEYSK